MAVILALSWLVGFSAAVLLAPFVLLVGWLLRLLGALLLLPFQLAGALLRLAGARLLLPLRFLALPFKARPSMARKAS